MEHPGFENLTGSDVHVRRVLRHRLRSPVEALAEKQGEHTSVREKIKEYFDIKKTNSCTYFSDQNFSFNILSATLRCCWLRV